MSAKPQQVKKASKTQGNIKAVEEAPKHPALDVTATGNKSETSHTASRTTANNSVGVMKTSNPPAPRKKQLPKAPAKPDSIAIKSTNSSLSGDKDQKEREDMLASPVKGSDMQTASMVSPDNIL